MHVQHNYILTYNPCVYFYTAPKDHPWRTMPRQGMTPHYSGTTLDAQARYAAGTKEILDNYFNGKEQRPEYLILDQGKLVSRAYSLGTTKQVAENAPKKL